jgi:phenylpropionate dioxygenase-like ring-hydroxylating dioxygenase large terminal subunit
VEWATVAERIGEAIRDRWHPIAPLEALEPGTSRSARLLDERLTIQVDANGVVEVRLADSQNHNHDVTLPTLSQYCCLWTHLGNEATPLFAIPEVEEPGRRILHAGTIGVHVSAPRAVENFLDMAHFPYVHTNILGVEPYTDVAEYQVHVDVDTNDLWATDCVFWQPMAATTSTEGQMTDYLYRVPHPYCVILYKTSPIDERKDVIALFCNPVAEDFIEANMFLCLLDDTNTTAMIRSFQLTIFGQDKPILENQYPKRLPLDPRAETPIRADKIAIAYRRWLSELGVDYGVIPAS